VNDKLVNFVMRLGKGAVHVGGRDVAGSFCFEINLKKKLEKSIKKFRKYKKNKHLVHPNNSVISKQSYLIEAEITGLFLSTEIVYAI